MKQKLIARQEKFEAKLENQLVFSNIDVTNFTGDSFLTLLHLGVSHNSGGSPGIIAAGGPRKNSYATEFT